jgi:class 3 adenylate cyclase/TolB-like protein
MTSIKNEKRHVVALNADVVGYSKLMSDDVETTTATMAKYRKLVTSTINENGGTLIDFVGDNFMAAFDDTRAAVQTAITITSEIERANVDIPTCRQVRFRMGIDLGEVVTSDGNYYGDALNIASRIQSIAPPGGLCISGSVYRELDEPALRFRPTGQQKLKNLPEAVDVYEFADLPSHGKVVTRPSMLALEAPTVAVLPIHTETADESVAGIARILRRDLIHELTHVPQLKVIDAKTETGKEGGLAAARYMIETGVHQFGDKVRVYATLFDVTTMNIVKTYKWSLNVEELFELSERFADDVARSVEIELIVGEPAGLYAELDDPEAIEKVYTGWYHLRSDTQEGWSRAVELFGQVAQTHPDKPYGHVLSAFSSWIGAANEWVSNPNEALSVARKQAQTGLDAGDQTGMARAVEASILMIEGRHDAALAVIEELGIIRPTCDVTYGLEGSVRRYMGQWKKAIELLDIAMRLTGINKPWYPTVKACSLYLGGKIEQAASVAELVLDYQPNNLEALLVLTAAQVELGMDRRAKATKELIRTRFPSVDVEAWLDKNPYHVQNLIDRWKEDLLSVGVIG